MYCRYDEEFERLVAECRRLLPAVGGYTEDDFGPYNDYITNVFLTDLTSMHNVAVDNPIKYYWNHRWHEIRQLTDLRAVLDRLPTHERAPRSRAVPPGEQPLGADRVAPRVRRLPRAGVADDAGAAQGVGELVRYEPDFRGRVRYLGNAACQWLRMRLGVDTVKPDVHMHNFVKHAVGATAH